MKNKFLFMFSAIAVVCLAWSVSAYSAILVVSAKGEASMFEGGQWKSLSKGQTLSEGAKISTGINSIVVLNIDGNVVTVKPMTSIKIYKNMANESSRETYIGLTHGAVQAKVNKLEKVKTKFNITTPVATSSVRGTEELVSYGPVEGMKIEVLEGIIDAFNRETQNSVTGRQVFHLLGDSARPGSVNGDTRNSWMVDIFAGNRGGDGSLTDSETVEGSTDRKDTGRNSGTSRVNVTVTFSTIK
jgi:hypothetical protein